MARAARSPWKLDENRFPHGIVAGDDSASDAFLMTMFSVSRYGERDWLHGHATPLALGGAITVGAIALVAHLLWPTWTLEGSSMPERLPVSVGGTLFNVPAAAIRMKIQRHSGAQ